MKTVLAALALIAAGVQPPSANPLTDGARLHYGIIKGYVTRAAAKMPESTYAFRPSPEVRTFAQLVGHLADANYRLCSIIAAHDPPLDAGIERSKTAKGDLVKALAESFTYCDDAYAAMSDDGAFHTAHAFEHYGNIVTYMRLKGIVPPSSEPPFGAYRPKD